MTTYLWNPPAVQSLPVRGSDARLPINRIFCVGRNYHAHAVEMGRPVDKAAERPFYFTKSPQTLVESGATVAYPPGTANYHYEMELVLVIGKPGFRVAAENAHDVIYGYACGLDMTRRDLQLVARDKGRPWGSWQGHRTRLGLLRGGADAGCRDRVRRDRAGGQRPDEAALGRGQADLEHPRNHRRPVAVLSPGTR